MGILLAHARLTIVLYSYNSLVKKHGRSIASPIIASPFFKMDMSDMKCIGIMPRAR